MRPISTIKKPALNLSRLILMLLTFICLQLKTDAQLTPFQEWTNSTGTQNFFMRSKTVTDGSGNVYVAGATVNGSGNYDILVSKFNSGGALQWSQQKDGLANFMDAATSLYVDGSGNVYITGFITDTLFHGTDVVTIKYNSSGVEQWVTPHNGVGNFHDFGSDIYVDGSGNVFVVGTCQNATPNADFMVIKYNSSGVRQWINTYNYPVANLDDAAARIKSVSAGKITVAGVIQLSANTYAYGHLSYNMSTGAIIGSLAMGTSSTYIEREFAYTKDNDGNTYLAGAIDNGVGYGLDYCIIKFDTSAAIVWERHYNGADGLEDIATDVAVDDDGNVYATGYTTTTTAGTNYTSLKFNSAGTQIWERHYNGEGNGADTAMAITMHSDTTFVITGSSFNGSNQDYYTIKYDTTGSILWEINYNSYYNKGDAAYCIAVDTLNAIIVTGQSYNDTAFSFTTVKYIDPYINDTLPDAVPVSAAFSFTENRGQVIDTDTLPVPGIKFYNNQQEYASYFTDTLISYVFARIDTSLTIDDTLFRIDMRFVDALAGAKVYGMHKKREFANYYVPQTGQGGRERVPHYGQLYMPSLWTNIDLMITSNPAGIKYAFILNPGFDPEKPLLLFEGADDLYIDGDDLIAETELGNLVFPQATVFQIENDGSYSALAWQPDYYINSDIASFTNYGSYDPSLPLVIVIENNYAAAGGGSVDPSWSTFIPGNSDDVANDVTNDPNGNTYVVGETRSSTFPVFGSGIFQGPYGGSYDAFAARFNDNYALEWLTYYGGAGDDYAISLSFDDYVGDKLYMCGSSASSNTSFSNVPAVIGTSYQESSSGAVKKGMLARLDATFGSRDWGTFFGGPSTIVTGIDHDASGNFFVTGHTENINYVTACTGSTNNFPGCNLAGTVDFFQPWHSLTLSNCNGAGWFKYDAFLARFNSDCQLTYSTLFGGCENDHAYDLVVDKSLDKVYIVGYTRSLIDNSLGTYCTGNQASFPHCDLGGAYLQSGLNGNLVNSGPNNDGFIARFNASTLRLEWSTFFGGGLDDIITGVDVDDNSNVYISGITFTNFSEDICSTSATQGFPYCGSLALSYGGGADNFIAKFNTSGTLEWSSYYGGVSNEYFVRLYAPDGTFYGPKIAYSSYHDKIFMQGVTETGSTSNDDIPLQTATSFFNSQAAHNDPGSNRNTDCYVAAFSTTGSFDYANYFGGTGFKSGTSNPRISEVSGGISTSNERVYICGGTYSTTNFPLACPSTTNPYCVDYNSASVSSNNSDAYVAQIYNNPFLSTETIDHPIISLLLYPNPASGSFTIEYSSLNNTTEVIEIYNLLGQKVVSKTINVNVGKNKVDIDCSILTEGIYLVYLKNSKFNGKIVIQK